MTGPTRWLDGGDASELERSILREARTTEPPRQAEERIWTLLVARLPPGPVAGGGAAGGGAAGGLGGAATGTALATIKSGLVGLLAGFAVAGTAAAVSSTPTRDVTAPAASVIAPVRRVAPRAAVSPRAASRAPVTHRVPVEAPARTARVKATPPPADSGATASVAISHLRQESRALAAARDAIKRGNAPTALAILEATRARFPGSVLDQELDALTIEALAESGQTALARQRARAFLSAFPDSPHVPAVRRFARP